MLGLMFLLGLFLGMFLMAGGKWKRRYREEVRRRELLETENKRLLSDTDRLHRSTARHRDDRDLDRSRDRDLARDRDLDRDTRRGPL
jgi:hypothetical protein